LSATAPKIGCDAPHMNWPTAIARLIEAMPRPVEVLMRRQEQAGRQARGHRDHQDGAGGQDQGQAPRGVIVVMSSPFGLWCRHDAIIPSDA
jgi:hypothetical protein